jgi:sugar lactone lactonase YvrE
VDDEGAIWAAMNGGGEVRRFAPDGSTLSVLPLPVSQPDVGRDRRRERPALFVTTAYENMTPGATGAGAGGGPGLRRRGRRRRPAGPPVPGKTARIPGIDPGNPA